MTETTSIGRDVSAPARVADADEGVTLEEVALATRNHGMPLEAMRYDVTPPGLHYVLIHYDIPFLEAAFTLEIDGLVERPLSITPQELPTYPSMTLRVTFECAGNGRAGLLPRPVSQPWLVEAVGTADWTGVPLASLLDRAGVRDGAHSVVFTGADHGVERGVEQDYQRGLTMAEVRETQALVAFAMNGAPLPPQHGFPLRLVVPGWYGMTQVKWLRRITVIDRPFEGFQNAVAYRLKQDMDETGTPVTRMEPRALLVPPGFPDFMTRSRVVRAGRVGLTGRAWSGWGPVERVEVSTDGGETWVDAVLEPPQGEHAWRAFSADWDATPGSHVLTVRASDTSGRRQPLDAGWNRGGFANNSAQHIPVTVVES
jgi:sulfite dehydrogenase (cytochrome) subunit A